MNEPTIFKFEQNDVRTITDEHGEPWFVAKDVCEVRQQTYGLKKRPQGQSK